MHEEWRDDSQSSNGILHNGERGDRGTYQQGELSSMVMTASTSYNTSKLDHLPRLRRQERNDAQDKPRKLSMPEKLERMRIEDRRRARNEEARQRSANKNGSRLRVGAPPFLPNSNFTSSASSRAGTSFYASTQLSQSENSEANRMFELRRKFAGPIPPSSWTNRNNTNNGNLPNSDQIEVEKQFSRQINRFRVLTATRHFFTNHVRQDVEEERRTVPGYVNSLLDLSLLSILNYATDESVCKSKHILQQISDLPVHLKERALSLAGRNAKTKSLNESALLAFFKGDDEEPEESFPGEIEDEEAYDHLPDAWDNESDSVDWTVLTSFTTLDLSFANIGIRSLRSLINSPLLQASHIRSLSLAGWGYGDENSQTDMRTKKCLRTSTILMNVLEQMSNLQFLSLAATKLLPGNEDWFNITKTTMNKDGKPIKVVIGLSPETASEALAFLKKLARRTSKLQTLDLSACRWINGAVLSNLGWYSTNIPIRRLIWPRLQDLILSGCPSFDENPDQDDDSKDEPLQIQSSKGTFVGTWHAAHHGIARSTESPYFLSHKPGLGRALLAHGIGAWDSVSSDRKTHALVGREAAALAHHHGHIRQARRLEAVRRGGREGLNAEMNRSAFDDESIVDLSSIASSAIPGIHTGFAISHGVAPFAGRRDESSSSSSSLPSWSLPPRCPVSGKRVETHEWERARVLDAVNGRWGSAIVGTIEEGIEKAGLGSNVARKGTFVNVYF